MDRDQGGFLKMAMSKMFDTEECWLVWVMYVDAIGGYDVVQHPGLIQRLCGILRVDTLHLYWRPQAVEKRRKVVVITSTTWRSIDSLI